MKCIYCGCMDSKVIDSRVNEDGTSIRRRRECTACGRRFTTYETVESTPILVVKNDGTRQAFDVSKIKRELGMEEPLEEYKPHIKGTFIEGTSHLKKSLDKGETPRGRRYKNVRLIVILVVLAALFWFMLWG